MKIGFFDSGLGGLSVLYEAFQEMPDHQFVFYADQKNVPYGEKSPEEVFEYSREATQFLLDQGCDAIVIACNTATSVAVKKLREIYTQPIISMEPAAKLAIHLYGDQKVMLCATPITIQGNKLKILLDKYDEQGVTTLLALPKLVRFAEAGIFEGEEVKVYLKEMLAPYNMEEYGSLVLGCTHFNYFKKVFKEIIPHIHFVDGNHGTILQLQRKLQELPNYHTDEPSVKYYISGDEVLDEHRFDAMFAQLEKVHDL